MTSLNSAHSDRGRVLMSFGRCTPGPLGRGGSRRGDRSPNWSRKGVSTEGHRLDVPMATPNSLRNEAYLREVHKYHKDVLVYAQESIARIKF